MALLLGGGFLAGIVNAMAGGGSVLTVPLLVVAGVEGNAANGSNRVGVLASSVSSAIEFARNGVGGRERLIDVVPPVMLGVVAGVTLVGSISDEAFERSFAVLMVPVLLLTFLRPGVGDPVAPVQRWKRPTTWVVFAAIGLYGGAFQAGVGLLLVAALTRSGLDLIEANFVKVAVISIYTSLAIPVFMWRGEVEWGPALVLAVALGVGSAVGARTAVEGGERVIRPVMVVAVLVFGARLLGLF